MGRPNWIAFQRVRAGQLQHRPCRPDQLVAEGELPEGHGGRPVDGPARFGTVRRHVAVHLEQARAPGSMPPTARRESSEGGSADGGVPVVGSGDDEDGLRTVEIATSRGRAPHSGRPAAGRGRRGVRSRGSSTVVARSRRTETEADDEELVERRRGDVCRTLALEEHRDGGDAGPPPGRRASRGRRARRRAPHRCPTRWRDGCPARRARARPPPSAVPPELEQPPGDDVALDLGAPAVDGRSARVEELGTPPPAHGSSPPARSAPRPSATRSNTACSAVATSTLSTEVSGPSVSPAASRRWVERDRARKAHSSSVTSPTALGSSAPGGDGGDQLLQPPLQVGGPVPQRRAPLVGEQVHGDRPAAVDLAEQSVERHHDVVEEDLAELLRAVHRLDRTHGDAGAVHVDEQRGDPTVGRFGRSRPGQEDAAVRVLGQARPDLLAR